MSICYLLDGETPPARQNGKRLPCEQLHAENASLKGAAQGLGELCDQLKTENKKLRELARDAIRATWACDSDVCVHGGECDEGIEYPTITSCLIEQRARELGVEV